MDPKNAVAKKRINQAIENVVLNISKDLTFEKKSLVFQRDQMLKTNSLSVTLNRVNEIIATYEDNVVSFDSFKGILVLSSGDFDLSTQITSHIVSSQVKATQEEFEKSRPFLISGAYYTFDETKSKIESS